MWIALGLVSMILLGLYDLCKKHALTGNAVLPTLFFSNLVGMSFVLPLILFSYFAPEKMMETDWYVAPLSLQEHGLILSKSLIVGTSWICAFYAMKNLPISIVSPIRSSGPLWTLVGAIVLFHEHPAPLQWAGMAMVLAGYVGFFIIGREEGVDFRRSKWIWLIFIATLIGTVSTLLDKWLLQIRGFSVQQVVSWYSVYLFIFFTCINAFVWWPNRHKDSRFVWRWTVPCIGAMLVLSDVVYFKALANPEALVVVLSVLRRCSVLVGFFVGAFLFKETNIRKKSWVLLAILIGVVLIVLSGA